MKKSIFSKFASVAAAVAISVFFLIGCAEDPANNSGGRGDNSVDDPSNGGGGGGSSNNSNTTREKAILVTVGNSSSHTISSSGEHWFKFVGTGDPVIFETTGSIVDTYITVFEENSTVSGNYDDNSGEGSNALYSFTTKSGVTYWIKVTARSSTSGTYSFVVKAPKSNLRTNPIAVSVGNSSSHTIFSNGTHWFVFTGTGERVFFETEGEAVNANMKIYIGESTSYLYSKESGNKGINFITVSGTTYYINITGNSGTYTFNVHNGTGDGSSRYNAIEVTNGYSSVHTITSSGEHWFVYQGTGNKVTFETTGSIVDTYITIFEENFTASGNYDDNSGEGSNALYSFTTKSGVTYWIKVTARSSTSGAYTFVVKSQGFSSSSSTVSSSSSKAIFSSSSAVFSSSSQAISSSSSTAFSSSSKAISSSSSAVFSSSSQAVSSSSSILQSSSSLATYIITYNAGIGVTGVTVPVNQTKNHDILLTLSTTVPTRIGYVFVDWNTAANGGGTSYAAGASYTDNASVTLYAQWNQDCDGIIFRTVEIGSQTWMAENLNCNVSGSKCYNNQDSYCSIYGRLYDWATAMALPSSCNNSFCASQINAKHKGICPSGWHIPSNAEWNTLITIAGGTTIAAKHLKAKSGWNDDNGLDSYGFSALPGGYGYNYGFSDVGNFGDWWQADEPTFIDPPDKSTGACFSIVNGSDDIWICEVGKSTLISVRCLKD